MQKYYNHNFEKSYFWHLYYCSVIIIENVILFKKLVCEHLLGVCITQDGMSAYI